MENNRKSVKPEHTGVWNTPPTIGLLIPTVFSDVHEIGWWGAVDAARNLDVNLIGFAIIVPATFLTVPLGVSMAHWLKPDLLRKAFALFLAFTASRMLWDIFT